MLSWATEAGETGGPAAPGCCFVALSSNGALSGLSAESLPGLGTSVPSTMAQNGCEMPPKPSSNLRPWGGHADRRLAPPSAPAKIESGASAVVGLQHTWTALRRRSGTRPRALGKPAEQAFRRLDVFRKDSHEPRFLPLLMPREALKSVTVTTALGFVIFVLLIIPHQTLNSI